MPGKNKKQLKTAATRRKVKRAKTKPSASSKNKGKTTEVAAVLDAKKLQDLYATMLKAHMLNQRAPEILSVRQKGLRTNTTGREAVLVGAIAHTLSGDSIAASDGGFLGSFIRGTPLRSVFEQASTTELQPPGNGSAGQNGTDSFAETAVARGMALATEIKGKPNVVLIFPGESPAGTAIHRNTLALAATNKLPLVCVMETRSTSSSAEEQGTAGNSSVNGARNFPQITVDGNDVVAVFRVAQEAVRRARTGHGPSLIECVMDHATEPPATRKLPKHTSAPLAFMQQYLQRRSLWSDEWQRKIADKFRQELDAAIPATGKVSAGQHRENQVYSPNRPASSTQSLP